VSAQLVVISDGRGTGANARFVTRAMAASPFEQTVWFDADTSCHGDPIELLDHVPFVVARQDYQMDGIKAINRRRQLERLAEILDHSWSDGLVARACKAQWPMINLGVFGLKRGSPVLSLMVLLSHILGPGYGNEVSMQVLLPDIKISVLSDRWHRSSNDPDVDGAVIWHWTGQRWRTSAEWKRLYTTHASN
jgi:hypothetical protein